MEQIESILNEGVSEKDFKEILTHYNNMSGEERTKEREWLSKKLKPLSQEEVKQLIAYVKKHDKASGTTMNLLKIKEGK